MHPINGIALHLKDLAKWAVGKTLRVEKWSLQRNMSKHLLDL